MAEYDGDIKLHVDLGEKNILQSLNDIKKKVVDAFSGKGVDELDKHVSNTNKTLQQTQKEFQKVQSEIGKTEGKLKELEARYNAIEKQGAKAATGSQQYKYNGLFYNKADAVKLEELRARLENMYSTLDGLRERSRDLNNNLSMLELGEEPTRQMNDLGRSTSEATSKTSGLRSAFSRVLTVIKRFGSTVVSVFKKLGLNVAKLARDITVKLGNAIIAPVKSIGNTVTSIFRRMFMSIRRVFVFSMLTSAFRGLREDIGNLISADTQLAASLKQIQSNLWTAFAPIYTAALPALRSLMGVLSQATGYVAAFFSALTGNTVSQSYSQAQNLKSSATSDDAKKKALDVEIKDINKKIKALNKERKAYEKQKKAEEAANKKSLLNFDTLNQLTGPDVEDEKLQAYDDQLEALQDQLEALQDQKDAIDAAAAAADELTYPKAAEAVYDKMKSLVDMLKDAWSDGDFTEIGEKLKNSIIDALNSIKWADIKRNVENIGKSLATFLNGLITPELGKAIGNSFGEYTNTSFKGISGFVDNIDAAQMGQSLSQAIVSAVNTIDWDLIKRTARMAGEKIAEFFNNAINPDSFGALGKALGSAIQTAIEFAYGFVEKINPINFGKSLAAFVNNSIKSIDWKMAAKTISDAIIKAFQVATTFFEETDWNAVGQAIADFLTNLDWGAMLYNAAKAIMAGLKAALKVVFKAGFGVELDDNTATWIAEAIGVGVLGAAIWKLISNIKGKLLPTFAEKDRALEEQTAKTAEEAVAVNALDGQFAGAGASAMAFVPALQGVTNAGLGLVPTLGQVLQGNAALEPAMQDVTTQANAESYALQNSSAAASAAGAAYSSVVSGAQTASSAVGEYVSETNSATVANTGFASGVSAAFQNISQIVVSNMNSAGSTISSFASSFGGMVSTVTGYAANIGTNIQAGLSKAGNGIASLKTSLGSVKNTIAETASNAISKFGGMASTIISKAKDVGEEIATSSNNWTSEFSNMASGTEKFAALIVAALAGIITAIASVMNGLSGMAASFSGLTLPSGYGTNFGGGPADLYNNISSVQMPYLAQGAVIPPNREFMAVLGDQKSGNNIEAPENLIRSIMREEMANFGGGNSDVNVTITGDMSKFLRVAKKESVRAGSSVIIGGNRV